MGVQSSAIRPLANGTGAKKKVKKMSRKIVRKTHIGKKRIGKVQIDQKQEVDRKEEKQESKQERKKE